MPMDNKTPMIQQDLLATSLVLHFQIKDCCLTVRIMTGHTSWYFDPCLSALKTRLDSYRLTSEQRPRMGGNFI